MACEGETTLYSIPDLVDVKTQSQVLGSLGMDVNRDPDGALRLKTVDETSCIADYELVRRMRASVCVLGPLLAKTSYGLCLAAGRMQYRRPAD